MNNKNVGMLEINQVINTQKREEFKKQFRQYKDNGNEIIFKNLTINVNKELARQNEQVEELQKEIDSKSTDKDRIEAIMKLTDTEMRLHMIQLNNHLFNPQQEEENKPVWNEQAGMYLTPEQELKEKRSKIMAIKDTKERQAMITANLHLFK